MFDSEFAQSLLERMGGSSASLVLDKNGICVFTSSAVSGVLGLTSSDLVGKRFIEVVKLQSMDGIEVPAEKHPVMRALKSADYIQSTPFFCRLQGRTPTDTFALTTIVISSSGQVSHVVVQIRKAKREVEVGEMKSLFVSFAAHQLKTPSSVVKGFLELMMRQGEVAYSADQWHFLTSAFESNENLIAISKTLLNMARLEGGLIEPNVREFDPNRALQSKIASFAPLYSTKRVTVNFSASQDSSKNHLNSDESFFMEIFVILLGNAIKHSPIGAEITVSCELGDTNCEVHVIDNGPGIPPAVQKKLFKASQDTSEDGNSHGLGLFMAKKYIALLGGTIGLAQTDQGSDFYFSVPNVETASVAKQT